MSDDGATTRARVVAALLRCLADRGLRHTTVDDVAVEAGVSRATLYRAFPGGRDTIVAAVVQSQLDELLGALAVAAAAEPDLAGTLVAIVNEAARWLTANEAIATLMFDEPAVLLTHLEFEQMDSTLAVASERLAPLLAPHLEEALAPRVGEWATRLIVSYLLFPSDELDLCERAGAARLVERHVLPAIGALAGGAHAETISTKVS